MQTPPPDVDVAMKKWKTKADFSLTRRQNELKRLYKIMSENFFVSDDYVSIVHVLPHFQVSTVVAKRIAPYFPQVQIGF